MLLIIPLLAHSQTIDNWQLYIGKTQIASANSDSIPVVQVSKNDTCALRFVFATEDTAFVKRIVVMNKQRIGIDSKEIAANANGAIFNIQSLYRQSNGKYLNFYIVKTSANPAKAALVRVAPKLICNLQWVQ